MNLRPLIILFCLFHCLTNFAQPVRIAILDFDNISGITKYDGLGKAMSSMLISDIESNVSSKRFQLVERSQIQKILKEQSFQASSSVNKNSAVQTGKLLGVKYLMLGDIFVLDDKLVINARLTNTETGEILFSKKQEGSLAGWLILKTSIAKELSGKLSMPFTEPRIKDTIIAPALLTTYASAIVENDKGNTEKSEIFIQAAKDFGPDFNYLDDLRGEVEKMKKQIADQGAKISVLEKSGGRIIGASTYKENLQNFYSNLSDNEEREKIVLNLIRQFPKQFDSLFIFVEFLYFHTEYNVKHGVISDQLSFATLNTIVSPLLQKLDTIENKTLYAKYLYLKSLYLLGNAFNAHFSDSIKFDKESYAFFKANMLKVINSLTVNEDEKKFYQFFVFSSFFTLGNNNTHLHPAIEQDVLNNFNDLFTILKFKYSNQVLEIIKKYNNNNSFYPYYKTNNYLEAALKLIVSMSIDHKAFKNTLSKIDEYLKTYLSEVRDMTKSSNNPLPEYFKNIEEICANQFAIPSVFNGGVYRFNEEYTNKYFVATPGLTPMDINLKKRIIDLDSVNRRYTWIYEYTDTMNFSSPCDFVKIKNDILRKSDSVALASKLYVLSNDLKAGSQVMVIFNAKNDTIPGIVIGKCINPEKNKFELIQTNLTKNINQSKLVLLRQDNSSSDYVTHKTEIDYKSIYDDYFVECENQKKSEQHVPLF